MLIRAFQTSLQKRPLLTQMVASGVISSTGDAISQLVVEKRNINNYDFWRTGRFFITSSCFIAPILSRWFRVLERCINKGPAKLLPLQRVIVDQTTFSPVFNGAILYVLRILEGYSSQESFDMMKRDWWTIYSSSLMLWPLVQLFNFYLIPINMRVIVIQTVALFWNCFLSFKTQAKVELPQEY